MDLLNIDQKDLDEIDEEFHKRLEEIMRERTPPPKPVKPKGVAIADQSAKAYRDPREPADTDRQEEDRIVRIYVGDSIEPFRLSEIQLCRCSKYFAVAFRNERWQEAREGVMRFPDDDSDVWRIFVHWLQHDGDLPELECPKIEILVDSWLIGDQYNVVDFQDEVMYALCVAQQDEIIQPKTIAQPWNAAPKNSRLRRNLAEYVVVLAEVRGAVKWKDVQTVTAKEEEFGKKVMKALHRHKEDPAPLNDVLFANDGYDDIAGPSWSTAAVWQRRYLVAYGPKKSHGWHWSEMSHSWRRGAEMDEDQLAIEKSFLEAANDKSRLDRELGKFEVDDVEFKVVIDGEACGVRVMRKPSDPWSRRIYGSYRFDGHSTDSSNASDKDDDEENEVDWDAYWEQQEALGHKRPRHNHEDWVFARSI